MREKNETAWRWGPCNQRVLDRDGCCLPPSQHNATDPKHPCELTDAGPKRQRHLSPTPSFFAPFLSPSPVNAADASLFFLLFRSILLVFFPLPCFFCLPCIEPSRLRASTYCCILRANNHDCSLPPRAAR